MAKGAQEFFNNLYMLLDEYQSILQYIYIYIYREDREYRVSFREPQTHEEEGKSY